MIIRLFGDIGLCIAPRMGTFWFRGPTHIYFLRAPWNRPLFSERYGLTKYYGFKGWRVCRRVKPMSLIDALEEGE